MTEEKHICDYGCGQEAHYQFKNGKWCCVQDARSCPAVKKRVKEKALILWQKLK